jgi:peptidyl-prolyl cis-trans isomerase A (cyclophilin A)
MNPIPAFVRRAARALLAIAFLGAAVAAQAQNTMVRLHTTQGPIDFKLLDSEAPLTVANFLAYVRGGDYTDVFVHRSAWSGSTPFVVQAGYYKWLSNNNLATVALRPAVPNEFSATRSNVRGTVAMAKSANDPNSATSQWFINMNDNSANLDAQNGGFTVFARVTSPGMAVADKISFFPHPNVKLSDTFTMPDWPLANGWTTGMSVTRNNAIIITEARELPAATNSNDRIFNYLEAAYPQYLTGSKGTPCELLGYVCRFYSDANAYIGTKGGNVYYLIPALGPDPILFQSVDDVLATAQSAGY